MEKKKQNTLLLIMGALVLVSLASRIAVLEFYTLAGIFQVISLVFVALYSLWLYRKPHGNLLKVAMLLFAVSGILSCGSYLMYYPDFNTIVIILACAAVCYGAGRLDKINQNKILFPVIDVVFIITMIICVSKYNTEGFVRGFSFFNVPISFTTLMIAYFVRYKEHKEAGISDK